METFEMKNIKGVMGKANDTGDAGSRAALEDDDSLSESVIDDADDDFGYNLEEEPEEGVEKASRGDGDEETGFSSSMRGLKGSMSQRKKSFNWDEEIPEEDKKSAIIKNPLSKVLKRFIPAWLRTVIYIIVGSVVIMTPSVLILILGNFQSWYSLVEDVKEPNFYMEFLRWSILFACLFSITLLARYLLRIFPFLILFVSRILFISKTENLKVRLEYFNAVRVYISYLLVAICIFTVNKVIFPFNPSARPRPYQWFILQVSWVLIVASLVILIEKLFLQTVSVGFHQVAYAERINRNSKASSMLDRLKAAADKMRRKGRKQAKDVFDPTATTPTTTSAIDMLGNKTMHGLQQVGERSGISYIVRSTKAAINRTAEAVTRKDNVEINSGKEARRLAKRIFESIAKPGETSLTKESFFCAFKSRDVAQECFEAFAAIGSHEITRDHLNKEISEIYKERKYLARSVRDIGHCIGQLDSIMLSICYLVLLIISCLIFEVDVTSLLASFGTLLLGLTFIFGSSAKNLFECLIFLFILHPYDVGDRIRIGDAKESMIVKEIGILLTVFTRGDGQATYVPHTSLTDAHIHNYRRSEAQSEDIEFFVPPLTPAEKISILKDRLNDFVNENPSDFQGPIVFTGFDIIDLSTMKIYFELHHRTNFQNMKSKKERRTRFIHRMQDEMKALGLITRIGPTDLNVSLRS